MANTTEIAKTFVATSRSAGIGSPVSSADGWFVVRGYPALTFNFKTSQIPVLQVETIEVSLATGVKDEVPSLTQTKQTIPASFIVRSSLGTLNDLNRILLDGDNGSLEIDYYINTKDRSEIKYLGKLEHGAIKIEEGIEIDTEGTTSTMTLQATFVGHYFKTDWKENVEANTAAIASINKVLENLVD